MRWRTCGLRTTAHSIGLRDPSQSMGERSAYLPHVRCTGRYRRDLLQRVRLAGRSGLGSPHSGCVVLDPAGRDSHHPPARESAASICRVGCGAWPDHRVLGLQSCEPDGPLRVSGMRCLDQEADCGRTASGDESERGFAGPGGRHREARQHLRAGPGGSLLVITPPNAGLGRSADVGHHHSIGHGRPHRGHGALCRHLGYGKR